MIRFGLVFSKEPYQGQNPQSNRLRCSRPGSLISKISLSWALLWLIQGVPTFCQGTLSINSATGAKPRITLGGVNVQPSDNIWVSLQVEGATGLSGLPAAPFHLTLTGANSGLFSKGILTVLGQPPGASVRVTLEAWAKDTGESYATASCRGSTSFQATLGEDGWNIQGLPPPSIVPTFTGLNLCCYSTPNRASTRFRSLPMAAFPESCWARRTEWVKPLDVNQDGWPDFDLVSVVYYSAPVMDGRLALKDPIVPSLRRLFCLPSTVIRYNTQAAEYPASFEVVDSNPVASAFETIDGIHRGWMQFSGTNLVDFNFSPSPDQVVAVGIHQFPKPDRKYEFDFCAAAEDLSSAISYQFEHGVDNLLVATGPTVAGDPTQSGASLLGTGWEILTNKDPSPGLGGIQPVTLTIGELLPRAAKSDESWARLDLPQLLIRAGITADGKPTATPWRGGMDGYFAVRHSGALVRWIHLAGSDRLRCVGTGVGGVVGGSEYFRLAGTNTGTGLTFDWVRSEQAMDFNRDGLADFVLRSVWYTQARVSDVDQRVELHLAKFPYDATSPLQLGTRELYAGVERRTGCFANNKVFNVQFPTSIGKLAGTLVVNDSFPISYQLFYEPVVGREYVYGNSASVTLNIWRLPRGHSRLTWPIEHSKYALEQFDPTVAEGWTTVLTNEAGAYDIPAGDVARLFRLRVH